MMHIAIVEAFVSDQEHLIVVTNHQFNWWFDISPQKGYVTARPKGQYRKHYCWQPL